MTTRNVTISVRLSPEDLKKVDKYIAHMERTNGVKLTTPGAIHTLTVKALNDFAAKPKR